MTYLKSAIFITFIVLIACAGYIYFNFNQDYQKGQVLEAYQKELIDKARQLLDKVKGHLSEEESSHIESYINRDYGDFLGAEKALSHELELLQGSLPEKELQIHQNRAINYLLQRDIGSLKQTLVRLQSIGVQNTYTPFFEGLLAFFEGEHTQASQFLSQEIPLHPSDVSPWFSSSFHRHVPHLLRGIFLARSQLSTQLEENRTYLEEALSSHKYSDLCELYLGVSYLYEANQTSYPSTVPYLTLAANQLKKIPYRHPFLVYEKEKVLETLNQHGNELIEQDNFETLGAFIDLYEAWQEKTAMAHFADKIILGAKELAQGKNRKLALAYAKNVEKAFSNRGHFASLLTYKLEKSLVKEVKNGDYKALIRYWTVATELSHHPKRITSTLSKALKEEALHVAQQDSAELDKTESLLKTISYFEKDPKQRYLFASQLMATSTGIWVSGISPKKAHKLMLMAASFPYKEEQEKMQSSIESFLQEAYGYARKNDDANNLPYLIKTMKHFNVESGDMEAPLEVGNQLADAEALLKRGRLFEACKKAEWVLHLFPDNSKAKVITGMVAYLEKDYERAITALSDQDFLSVEASEALGISYLMLDETDKGVIVLEGLANEARLSDKALEQLGTSYLISHHFEKAYGSLKQIQAPKQETFALLSLASYKKGAYQEALHNFGLLSPSLRETPLMLQAAFESHHALNQEKEAEGYLQEAHKHMGFDISELPKNFQKVYQSLWTDEDFYSLSGSYYQEELKDPKKALRTYKKISSPNEKVQLKQAQALLEIGQGKKAGALIGHLMQSDSIKIRRKALSLSIIQRHRKGESYRALLDYAEKVKSQPHEIDLASKRVIATVLYEQKAWSDAVAVYEEIRGIAKLSNKEEIHYIESLLNSGSNKTADSLLSNIKKKAPSLNTNDKIELVGLIAKMKGKKSATVFLSRLPSFSVKQDSSMAKLSLLYLRLGDLKSAQSIAESYEPTLRENSEGLRTLITLAIHNKDKNLAHRYARQFVRKAPLEAATHLSSIRPYLTSNEKALMRRALLKKLNRNKEKSILTIEGTLAFQMAYPGELPENANAKINQSLKLYSRHYPMHGHLALLQAKNMLQQEEYTLAESLANRSLSLDPHSSEAYKVLAEAHHWNGKNAMALRVLEQASKTPYFDIDYEETAWETDTKSLLR